MQSLVSLLNWKMLNLDLSLFSYSFFTLSLIFIFSVDKVSIDFSTEY